MVNFNFLKYVRYPKIINRSGNPRGICDACGLYTTFEKGEVINTQLTKTWELSSQVKYAFDKRESMICSNCGNSYRARNLAKALLNVYGKRGVLSLKGLVMEESFRNLKIAEINSCGNLHPILKDLPKLFYSEYQGSQKFRNTKEENLESLSYKSNFFDLIITSETLEHILNIDKALTEIYRVLKTGGRHVFTIPVISARKTRDRIILHRNNKVEKILSDSFHGSGDAADNIVFREFGGDVPLLLEKLGFKVRIYFYNFINDDYSFVFVTQKL